MAIPSQQYTLRFRNRSESQHDFLCYQQGIDVNLPNVYTLAWFAKPVANDAFVDFTWTIDYNFVWSEQGMLVPGVKFQAGQVVPAGLRESNRVEFTRIDGAFQFASQSSTGAAGSLTINGADGVPKRAAKFGIGMSGYGTHVVDAEPNFAAIFTPHPEYWVSFGDYDQGEVLDIQTLVNAAKVPFPANVYEMTVALDAGNNWTVAQGLV
ncbi:hypothetical protein CCR97_03410 [Rhodoplanes elegans]|uniref:Protein rhiA n=1 Tax=Rhodoplanes elegans TaxID=29408 RepID=A0A327K302_9BRAD|nr:protein rhiA [Rhodoplanes elegans]MBK5957257.1 hypothetical protein [Rhodoplanes elegans]RAI31692.1 hypothetical protein CH338_25410 [Rhodoplanes elegans]